MVPTYRSNKVKTPITTMVAGGIKTNMKKYSSYYVTPAK